MLPVPTALARDTGPSGAEPAVSPAFRLRAVFDECFDYVWRLTRRLGVPEASVDDAVQQAFCVLSDKLERVEPGKERAFLTAIAVRIASNSRRSERRRRERADEGGLAQAKDPSPGADDLIEERRRRMLLDRALGALPLELRTVFVLDELEALTAPEIARLVGVPVGTVASRLRRARTLFLQAAEAVRAEEASTGRTP
jgi:RNA polymerase sigma-70 factor, ECF subfamily